MGANPFTTGDAGSGTVTVTATGHGAQTGDFVTFSGAATTDGVTAAQLNTEFKITVNNSNSYRITTAGSASSGSTAGGGSSVVAEYQTTTGLSTYVQGTGFGAGLWGGTTSGVSENTLASDLTDSATSVVLTSASNFEVVADTLNGAITINSAVLILDDASSFPSEGTVLIGSEKIDYTETTATTITGLTRGVDGTTVAAGSDGVAVTFVGMIRVGEELIQYTGKSGNTLNAGVVRGVRGTTAAAHSSGAIVAEANTFIGWGEPAQTAANSVSQLRLWKQDNCGEDLIFNVFDGAPFYWDKTLGLNFRSTALSAQAGASNTPTITPDNGVRG